MLALLCLPSTLKINHNNVFDVHRELPLDANENFVRTSIIDVFKQNCSGWHHAGLHEKYRTDDEHIYVPTSYAGKMMILLSVRTFLYVQIIYFIYLY